MQNTIVSIRSVTCSNFVQFIVSFRTKYFYFIKLSNKKQIIRNKLNKYPSYEQIRYIFSQDIFFNYFTLHYITLCHYICKICNFIRITSLNSTASQQYHVLNQIIYYWAKKKCTQEYGYVLYFRIINTIAVGRLRWHDTKIFFFFRYLLIT